MNSLTLIGLSLATSMDAFTASIARGTSSGAAAPAALSDAIRTGLVFGTIQAITTVAGWSLGKLSADHVSSWSPLISLAILSGVGALMVRSALSGHPRTESAKPRRSLAQTGMTGLATSMDAVGIGASLAFSSVNISFMAASFGLVTFFVATLGTVVSGTVRQKLGHRAELAGGLLLVAIGIFNYLSRPVP